MSIRINDYFHFLHPLCITFEVFLKYIYRIGVPRFRCNGEDVRLMLWDTAGQEEFDAITKAYYRGAQACVLAFSTTDRNSFEAIHSWKIKVSYNFKFNNSGGR